MVFIKFILLICLTLPCIWGMPSEQAGTEPQLTTKINWGPVWDDIAGDNEFVVRMQDAVTDQGKLNLKLPIMTLDFQHFFFSFPSSYYLYYTGSAKHLFLNA